MVEKWWKTKEIPKEITLARVVLLYKKGNPEIQENIQNMIENQDIELLDEKKKPFLHRQITDHMEKKQNQGDEETESVNIRIPSSQMNKIENAELAVNENKYSDLQNEV